ncbi:protein UL79 [Vespertilionid gammaherpesvirus 1]|uniref:Protein UL79 n=1 Tax=Vespertilionid gammaherpesvirus 1 TaxID=2560830 RepID=A0A120HQH8_9GAMA|nr:protein UL79 [Myotis gammaherpesvirus 8]AMA67375.1 protein UL79 [Vespertilionid gammaherpesvirus 1]
MDILGKYVTLNKKMSRGLEKLMVKTLQQKTLNNYNGTEVKFIHMIMCKMYNFCLNSLLFRESISNTGCRNDIVLSRKVPLEIWKLIYDGCKNMGVTDDMLSTQEHRAALWLHFNSHPKLLEGLTSYVTHRLGVYHHVHILPNNITDGNYLYNLGAVLPSRILMVIAFCLLNWGNQNCESWVRFFTGKIFIFYLIVTGYIKPKKTLLLTSASMGYVGPLELIADDIRAMRGTLLENSLTEHNVYIEPLDYLFIFNNNVLF